MVDPVQAALDRLEREQSEKDAILRQAAEAKEKDTIRQQQAAQEAEEEKHRISQAGKDAAQTAKVNFVQDNRRRREEARQRAISAKAAKEAANKKFQAEVDEYVRRQIEAEQATRAAQEANDKAQEASDAAQKATEDAAQANAAMNESRVRKEEIAARIQEYEQKLADAQAELAEINGEDGEPESEQIAEPEAEPEQKQPESEPTPEPAPRQRPRRRPRNIRASVPESDSESAQEPVVEPEPTPEPAQNPKPTSEQKHEIRLEIDGDDDDDDELQILDFTPMPVTYRPEDYHPVSDSMNTFQPAIQPIKSFNATVYLGVKYDRFTRRGAFAYYIVTADKQKNLLHGEVGYSDDSFEYTFLGTLLLLQDSLRNNIHEILIVVQDEITRDVISQNATNLRDNFSETRGNFIAFMRANFGVKITARFGVLSKTNPDRRHAHYMKIVNSLAATMVKD